jgi:hypothetical protein
MTEHPLERWQEDSMAVLWSSKSDVSVTKGAPAAGSNPLLTKDVIGMRLYSYADLYQLVRVVVIPTFMR